MAPGYILGDKEVKGAQHAVPLSFLGEQIAPLHRYLHLVQQFICTP
jgi:hypothetical protein